jgi:F0F1-type ATP synthase assembly protein I
MGKRMKILAGTILVLSFISDLFLGTKNYAMWCLFLLGTLRGIIFFVQYFKRRALDKKSSDNES